MKKIKIALLFGGDSSEHDISILSAKNIVKYIDTSKYSFKEVYFSKDFSFYEVNEFCFDKMKKINNISLYLKKIDVVFPIIHGKYGEDGGIQGFLKIINVPFIGCDILSSSLTMDKIRTKMILDNYNILQAKYLYLKKSNNVIYYIDNDYNKITVDLHYIDNLIRNNFNYPVFVKPSKNGSSYGCSKVSDASELLLSLEKAFVFDEEILIEDFIESKEIECAVLTIDDINCSIGIGKVVTEKEFYSYDAKYNDSSSYVVLEDQLDLTVDTINKLKTLSIKIFQILNCNGLSRIDFFVDKNNNIYFNEINTMPGFTNVSMFPMICNDKDISNYYLLDLLVKSSVKNN